MRDKTEGQSQLLAKLTPIIFLSLLIPLIFGLISLYLGKDINWDLKNYHYYNAYAFLENRLDYDIAPAQLQTYFNPILDIPFYLLVKNFSSSTVGFIFGYIHGINLSLIFLLTWYMSKSPSIFKKYLLGTFIVIISSTGPGFLSELGNSMNDNLISIFTLLAFLILVISSIRLNKERNIESYFQVCIAGLIMGLSVGLKQTAIIYAVCSALFLSLLYRSLKIKLLAFGIYGLMGIIGFLMSGSFWLWKLWINYGNPLFPFYNNIFRSPYIAPISFLDLRFHVKSFYEYLIWPIIMSINSYRVCELKYSDIRFVLFYFAMIGWIVWRIQKNVNKNNSVNPQSVNNLTFDLRIGNYLLAFVIGSFFLWMVQFSYYRYIIPLELLIPLCFIVILDRIFHNKKIVTGIIIFSLILGVIIYKPFNWGRQRWSTSYIEVDASQYGPEDNAIVVMLGMSPMSYIIPEFPEGFMFIRPESNFMQDYKYGLYDQINDLIKRTKYPIYVLYDKNDNTVNLNGSLTTLELNLIQNECTILVSNFPDELVICKVIRNR